MPKRKHTLLTQATDIFWARTLCRTTESDAQCAEGGRSDVAPHLNGIRNRRAEPCRRFASVYSMMERLRSGFAIWQKWAQLFCLESHWVKNSVTVVQASCHPLMHNHHPFSRIMLPGLPSLDSSRLFLVITIPFTRVVLPGRENTQ